MRNYLPKLGLVLLLLCIPAAAWAQADTGLSLSQPDVSAFPQVELYLHAYNDVGSFRYGLQPDDLTIIEDDKQLRAEMLQLQRSGVQLVVALNPGAAFALRNAQGVTRYEVIIQTLQDWARQRQGSTLDDLSLLVNNGPSLTHTRDSQQWQGVLQADTSKLRQARPSLDVLQQAVEIAADPTPRPGMNRVVLLITPVLNDAPTQALEDLAKRCAEQGVRLVIWVVAEARDLLNPSAVALAQLSAQTGGAFWAYLENDVPPSPENYLEALRPVYRLVYSSQVSSSGAHRVVIEARQGEAILASPELQFNLDVQPPNPVFVAPPLEIQRSEAAGGPLQAGQLRPGTQELQMVVDFPDGRPRSLRRSALYVDGVLVAQNETAPFEYFTWDLSGYTSEGDHLLRVEAEDVLGLVGSSIETQVRVLVPQAQTPAWDFVLSNNLPVLVILVLVLAGAALVLVLIIAGRLKPAMQNTKLKRRIKGDPVTQPVVAPVEAAENPVGGWKNRLQWPQRAHIPKPVAFLVSISDQIEPATTGSAALNATADQPAGRRPGSNIHLGRTTPDAIPIPAGPNTLGRSPAQASIVLDDPSVDALHARLTRDPDGGFRLADAGSIAGTWINYTPISQEGARLEHDDLVHIGRLGFRFQFRRPLQVRRPVVTQHENTPAPEETPEAQP